jgi:PhnB protein
MDFRPYLAFAGTAREAFTRYQAIFGGELMILTAADAPEDAVPAGGDPDFVLHAALTSDDALLMGSDAPPGTFDGVNKGVTVNCSVDDAREGERVFAALADGGQVQLPLMETFFSPAFGQCIDRFGVPWMVVAAAPEGT